MAAQEFKSFFVRNDKGNLFNGAFAKFSPGNLYTKTESIGVFLRALAAKCFVSLKQKEKLGKTYDNYITQSKADNLLETNKVSLKQIAGNYRFNVFSEFYFISEVIVRGFIGQILYERGTNALYQAVKERFEKSWSDRSVKTLGWGLLGLVIGPLNILVRGLQGLGHILLTGSLFSLTKVSERVIEDVMQPYVIPAFQKLFSKVGQWMSGLKATLVAFAKNHPVYALLGVGAAIKVAGPVIVAHKVGAAAAVTTTALLAQLKRNNDNSQNSESAQEANTADNTASSSATPLATQVAGARVEATSPRATTIEPLVQQDINNPVAINTRETSEVHALANDDAVTKRNTHDSKKKSLSSTKSAPLLSTDTKDNITTVVMDHREKTEAHAVAERVNANPQTTRDNIKESLREPTASPNNPAALWRKQTIDQNSPINAYLEKVQNRSEQPSVDRAVSDNLGSEKYSSEHGTNNDRRRGLTL
ncbi:MAG: hypothetical protein KIT27_11745 [Legionellales bacterium]|nr:hypothetical protein [Legionellales bacterium]